MPRRRGYRRSDSDDLHEALRIIEDELFRLERGERTSSRAKPKPKRKLSAWNKYVKANSKKPRFRYRNGKLNLKKMAVAFRKTPAGKKKRR
jgi:hypothetical protein